MAQTLRTGTLKLETYPNRYSTVIPPEAPFYRDDLVLTDEKGEKLIEGLDYYLVYYYKEASDAVEESVFGGFMLLNHTVVKYSLVDVGLAYRVSETEIGRWLVSVDLKDPRNVDWSALLAYAPPMPAVDPPTDYNDALKKDEIVASLDKLANKIIEKAGMAGDSYKEVSGNVAKVGARIYNDELYQHPLNSPAHGVTANTAGALGVDESATDSAMAYGFTPTELADILITAGVTSKDVDFYTDSQATGRSGVLPILNNDTVKFSNILKGTNGRDTVTTIQGGKVNINTDYGFQLTANTVAGDNGMAAVISAGMNFFALYGGYRQPVYNGHFAITAENINTYLYRPTVQPAYYSYKSTDSVSVVGNGATDSPVGMFAWLPDAGVGKSGLPRITSLKTNDLPTYAVSLYLANQIKAEAANYLDETYQVNGKAFGTGQEVTITKAELGIDKIDNTAPEDKPVTNAEKALLAGKALKGHKHPLTDITNVPYAGPSSNGLMKLYDKIDPTVTDGAVTARQAYLLNEEMERLKTVSRGVLPAWSVFGASYGNPNFLPIPAQGNYTGYGYDASFRGAAARVEGAYLYVLRSATNGPADSERILYWYANINSNGVIGSKYPTAFAYQPAGMTLKYPGVYPKKIGISSEDGMIFYGSDGNFYLVLFNGTMDYRKHTTVTRITFDSILDSTGNATTISPVSGPGRYSGYWLNVRVFINGSRVYVVKLQVAWEDQYMAMWSASIADLSKTDVVMKKDTLKGPHQNGDIVHFFEQVPAPASVTTDVNTKRMFRTTAAAVAKYTRQLTPINHYPTTTHAVQNNKVRFMVSCESYCVSEGSISWRGPFSFNLMLDLTNNTASIESDIFPICIDDGVNTPARGRFGTGLDSAEGPGALLTWVGSGEYLLGFLTRAYNAQPGIIIVNKRRTGSMFEEIKLPPTVSPRASSMTIEGAYGSLYRQQMRGVVHLGGSSKMVVIGWLEHRDQMYMQYTTDTRYFDSMGGYGPSNNRGAIPAEDYRNFLLCANVYDGSNYKLNGRLFTAPGAYKYKNIVGSTTFTADTIEITQAHWDSVATTLKNAVPASTSSLTRAVMQKICLYDIGGLNVALVMLTHMQAQTADSSWCNVYTTIWKTTFTVSNGVATVNLTGMVKAMDNYVDPETAISYRAPYTENYVVPKLIKRSDGWVISMGNAYMFNVLGDTRFRNFIFDCDTNWADWHFIQFGNNPGTSEGDIYFVPETKQIAHMSFLYGGLYLGGQTYTNNLRLYRTTAAVDNMFFGAKTAEGWLVYITEKVRFYINSQEHFMDEWYIDLKAAFPSTHQNATFYFYASTYEENGTTKTKYIVTQTKVAETENSVYIGYVTTDEARVTETALNPVKRLGAVKHLTQHTSESWKHDIAAVAERTISPIGLLRPFQTYQRSASLSNYTAYTSATGPTPPELHTAVGQPELIDVSKHTSWMQLGVDMSGWWEKCSQHDKNYRDITGNALGFSNWVTSAIVAQGLTAVFPNGSFSCPGSTSFGTYVDVDCTTTLLRVVACADDWFDIYVDGVWKARGEQGYEITPLLQADISTSPGKHRVSLIWYQGGGNGGSPCWGSLRIYAVSGTGAATEIGKSGKGSLVGYIDPKTSQWGTRGSITGVCLYEAPNTAYANDKASAQLVVSSFEYNYPIPVKTLPTADNENMKFQIATEFWLPSGEKLSLKKLHVSLRRDRMYNGGPTYA